MIARVVAQLALLLLLVLCPVAAFAGTTYPAGIPKDVIWFSKDTFNAGEAVTIFTVVYNSTDYQFNGTVDLRDGSTTIGTKTFSVKPQGGAEILAFPWTATAGAHSFSAVIPENELSGSAGAGAVNATLPASKTVVVKRFVSAQSIAKVVPKPAPATTASTTPPPPSAVQPVLTAIGEQIESKLPEPLVSKTMPILGAIEDLRVAQVRKADERINTLRWELKTFSGTSSVTAAPPDGWETIQRGFGSKGVLKSPFAYVSLFFALIVHFFASHAWLFYLLLASILYKLVRILFGLFF